jgi:hypothetical protein
MRYSPIPQCIYDYLYALPEKYLDNKLSKIAKTQSKIISKSVCTITYKGLCYPVKGHDSFYSNILAYPLHPSLYTQMEEYIKEAEGIEKEKEEVIRFIGIALSYNFHYDTYVSIFTEPITKYCVTYSNSHFSTKQYMTPEEFINKPEYKLIIEKIRQRIIDNLLMKDIYNES